MGQHDELVHSNRHRQQAALGRLERQDPEIETPVKHFPGDLSRQHPPNLDLRLGVPLAESGDHGQQYMDRRLVCPDQDPPPSQVLELADRRLGFLPQLRESLRVVEEDLPGLGELSILR